MSMADHLRPFLPEVNRRARWTPARCRARALRREIAIMKPIATLKLSPRVKNVISFAQSVSTAMTGNASFSSPNPTLATLNADIAALVAAEAAVLSRMKGAAVTRDEKLAVVKDDLLHLRGYVQQVADANPTTAQSIIESSGMSLRTLTLHTKSDLTVKQIGRAHV